MRDDSFRKKSTLKKGQAAHNKGKTHEKLQHSMPTEVSWKRPSKEEYERVIRLTKEGGQCSKDLEGNLGSEKYPPSNGF